MRPPVSRAIPQSEKTVLAAAYLRDGEPVLFSREQFQALHLRFPEFTRRALENASSKTLKAEFVRDKNQVIECAYLHSEDPLTATAVLSPEFYRKFVAIFGPNFLVAIPNRFSIYCFPALASKYRHYAGKILEAYEASAFPVSLEVFELSGQGLKAVGTYEKN